jgi:anti-anti-sigma regulatory factor
MSTGKDLILVCDTSRPTIRVGRFVQPDLRAQLDSSEDIAHSAVFEELGKSVLQQLKSGETVVLNLGLIDWFPTAFYRLLLRVNEEVKAAGARLLLCCLPPRAKEAFELMGGDRTFASQVCESETRALYVAAHPSA